MEIKENQIYTGKYYSSIDFVKVEGFTKTGRVKFSLVKYFLTADSLSFIHITKCTPLSKKTFLKIFKLTEYRLHTSRVKVKTKKGSILRESLN